MVAKSTYSWALERHIAAVNHYLPPGLLAGGFVFGQYCQCQRCASDLDVAKQAKNGVGLGVSWYGTYLRPRLRTRLA